MLTHHAWIRSAVLVAAYACGILLISAVYWPKLSGLPERITDFTGFLSGASLVGTPSLYELNANLEAQRRLVGQSDPARVFPRWPYWAVALQPLTRLPYSSAVHSWLLLSCAALAGFVLLLPGVPRWTTLLAVTWSIPVYDALGQGQDSPLILLFLATAMALNRKGSPLWAGLVISLCALKYHLLVLIPILLVVKRAWRFLLGGVAGGVLLIAVSTFIQGPAWIGDHLKNISRPEIDAIPRIMPNLRGALHGLPHSFPWEILLALVVSAWVGWLIRRATFEQGLCLVLIGGMLVSHHAYLHDWTILVPAFVILYRTLPGMRPLSLAMLSPLPTFPLAVTSAHSGAISLVCFLFVYLVAITSELTSQAEPRLD